MDRNEHIVSILKKELMSQKYKVIVKIPAEFFLTPDIFVKKGNSFEAFYVRQNDSIPEIILQRIASKKLNKNKVKIHLVFPKKPKFSTIKNISLYGLGIKYFLKNNILTINDSKKFSKVKERIKSGAKKKVKKMGRQDVFISSHQEIEERKIAEELIDELREAHRWPIFPIKVEDDSRYTIDKTKECINQNLKDSELFLGILGDQYRPIVEKEIKDAFKIFRVKDICIFIKFLRNRPKEMEKLIKWIKRQKNVKYLEYSDIKDYKTKLRRSLFLKVKDIHDDEGIPFP